MATRRFSSLGPELLKAFSGQLSLEPAVEPISRPRRVSAPNISSLVSEGFSKILDAVLSMKTRAEEYKEELIRLENIESAKEQEALFESRNVPQLDKRILQDGSYDKFDDLLAVFFESYETIIQKFDEVSALLDNVNSGGGGIGLDLGNDYDNRRRSQRSRRRRPGRISSRATPGLNTRTKRGASATTQRAKSALSRFANVSAMKQQIRQIAGPIISKGLSKSLLKSIPIVGIIGGLSFAVNRLIQGDPTGAALEAISSVGGPATAIPAFIASVTRDVYSSVFGVNPESDPNSIEHMKIISSTITEMAKSVMGGPGAITGAAIGSIGAGLAGAAALGGASSVSNLLTSAPSSSGSSPASTPTSSGSSSGNAAPIASVISPTTSSPSSPPSSSGTRAASPPTPSMASSSSSSGNAERTPSPPSTSGAPNNDTLLSDTGEVIAESADTSDPQSNASSNSTPSLNDSPESNFLAMLQNNASSALQTSNNESGERIRRMTFMLEERMRENMNSLAIPPEQMTPAAQSIPNPRSSVPTARFGSDKVPDPTYFPESIIAQQIYFSSSV